jgi:hypothetical protein
MSPDELDPVLDPFALYATYGEEHLARQLAALSPQRLRTIIIRYNLADDSRGDLEALTAPELIGWIVGAVRGRLAS